MQTSLLELQSIKKYFPIKKGLFPRTVDYVRAVDNVSLNVAAGQHMSIVGESGCGKTTLGRVILRLIPHDSGRVIFQGKDISDLSVRALRPLRQDMQMVFQDPFSSLDPRFTIRSILKEAMLMERNRAEEERRMAEMLSAVGLSPAILSRFPHEFSGGERQRIAIARALIMNPKLLILDEAVSALDVLIQEQIVKLLLDLQKKFQLTYLFISHNLRVVRKISHTIAVMYRGRIIESAPADEIFRNPLHPYTQELLAGAIEYRATERKNSDVVSENTRWTERSPGHWVRE